MAALETRGASSLKVKNTNVSHGYLITKGAYHLLELTGPKELVRIAVNRKVKTDPRNYSRDPCVDYTQEVI